jgi:hypothetical protein
LGENEIEAQQSHRRMLTDELVCCSHLLMDWTSSLLSLGYFLNKSGVLLFVMKLLATSFDFTISKSEVQLFNSANAC